MPSSPQTLDSRTVTAVDVHACACALHAPSRLSTCAYASTFVLSLSSTFVVRQQGEGNELTAVTVQGGQDLGSVAF
eukprot:5235-Eustigmatos_ZCMA.PRE.1